eukprot:16404794-Heterocapsa_arctica.AAC.1
MVDERASKRPNMGLDEETNKGNDEAKEQTTPRHGILVRQAVNIIEGTIERTQARDRADEHFRDSRKHLSAA